MANQSFSFLTLDIQGLRHATNRRTLFLWLNCVKPNVIALQETHSVSEEQFHDWVQLESRDGNNLQRYVAVSSPGTARSCGVAILYKSCLKVNSVLTDSAGRFINVCFSHSDVDSSFHVLNIYGRNQKQAGVDFFSSLLMQVDPSISLILCGDFNTVVDPHLDRFGCNPSSAWAYNWPTSLSILTDRYQLIFILFSDLIIHTSFSKLFSFFS